MEGFIFIFDAMCDDFYDFMMFFNGFMMEKQDPHGKKHFDLRLMIACQLGWSSTQCFNAELMRKS